MKRFLCILMLVSSTVSLARADDLDVVYQRLYDNYLGSSSLPSASAIQTYIDTQQSDGSWTDINYNSQAYISGWDPNRHWSKLLYMAISYQKTNSTFYKSTILKDKIKKGLLYWYNRSPQPASYNWFDTVIGMQLTIRQIMILMRDDFSGADFTAAIANISNKYLVLPPDFYTASKYDATNNVWVAGNLLNGAIATKDETKLKLAVSIMGEQLAVSQNSNGIQVDNSFHFHGGLIYNGGYGLSMLEILCYYMYQIRGISVAGFNANQINTLSNLLLNGDQWMVLGKTYDFSVVGREISRINQTKTSSLKTVLTQAKEIDPAHAAAYQVMYNNINDETGATTGVTGNRYFYRSDYMVQKKANTFIGIKMNSSRTPPTESINSENKLGNWLSLGATCIMRTGSEYYNIYGVWDWTKIPGVTNPEVEVNWTVSPGDNIRQILPTAGGVSDSHDGVTGMSLNRVTNVNGISVDIKAKKANFLWNKEMVCLGTGIQSSYTGAPVTTTINQTYLLEYPTVNGTALSSFGESTYSNGGWVYHDGVGYIVRNGGNFKLKEDYQTGNWANINSGMKNESIKQRIFKLWIDHGTAPTNASYDYVVLPNYTIERTSDYVANPTSQTLSNTADLQAVTETSIKQTGAVFYNAGSLVINPDLKVTVDKPCILLVKWDAVPIQVTLADINQNQTNINVTLTYKDLTSEVMNFALPQGDLKGISVKKFSVATPQSLPVKLISFKGTNTSEGVLLKWNTTSETNLSNYVLKKSTNGVDFWDINTTPANNFPGTFTYSFLDSKVIFGNQYYKLLSFDKDGTISTSDPIIVKWGSRPSVSMFPNPTKGIISIDGLNLGDIIIVSDLSGKLVQSFTYRETNNNVMLDLNGYSPGIYVLKVTRKGQLVYSDKIVKTD